MKIQALLAGAAIVAIAAPALAATTHHRSAKATSAGAYAAPKQPVSYTELNSYLRASPHARASKDWSMAATTGSSVNASATQPAPAAMPDQTATPPAPPGAPATDTAAGAATSVPPAAPVPEAPANGSTTAQPSTTPPPAGTAVNPPAQPPASPDQSTQTPPAAQPAP